MTLLCYRHHTIKSGNDIIPYKAIASHTRSKTKEIKVFEQKMNEMFISLENNVLAPSIDNEFSAFLVSLTKEVQVDCSQSKSSFTFSSSGSSVISMLNPPVSPDSVLPGSSTCSQSGNSHVKNFSSCPSQANTGISHQNDEISKEQSQPLSQSSSYPDLHFGTIKDLPGITSVINQKVQVSSHYTILSQLFSFYNFRSLTKSFTMYSNNSKYVFFISVSTQLAKLHLLSCCLSQTNSNSNKLAGNKKYRFSISCYL